MTVFLVLFLLLKGTAKSNFFIFLCVVVVGVVFFACSGRSRSNSALNNN